MMSAVFALDMSGFLENSESWIQWTLLPEPLLKRNVSRLTALARANSPMRIITSRRGLDPRAYSRL